MYLMSLPNELEKRKRIAADLERGINLLNEIDMLESSIEDLASTLQDEDVCKAKLFKDLLKAKYEGEQLLLKAKQKVDDVESAIAEVEILSKVK
jgi:hypothetical protein